MAGDKKPFPLVQSSVHRRLWAGLAGRQMARVPVESKRVALKSTSSRFRKVPVNGRSRLMAGPSHVGAPTERSCTSSCTGNMIAAEVRVTGSSLDPGVPRILFGLAQPSTDLAHASLQPLRGHRGWSEVLDLSADGRWRCRRWWRSVRRHYRQRRPRRCHARFDAQRRLRGSSTGSSY